jgi:outer membrane immunogenic protein
MKGVKTIRAAFALAGVMALGAGAQAADLGRSYVKAAPAAAVYDWSGFYLGGQAGGVYGRNNVTTPGGELLNPISIHDGAFFAGGGGYNFQSGNLVYGIDADFSGVLGGRALSARQQTIAPGVFAKSEADPKWLATVSGRLGFAADNWLLYVKGGGAWAKTDYKATVETGAGVELATQSAGATRSGWLVGAGIDYAWNRNWVSRIEYNYIDFGTKRGDYTFVGLNAADYKSSAHLVKAGLAYKF